jgi:hypothetical protein
MNSQEINYLSIEHSKVSALPMPASFFSSYIIYKELVNRRHIYHLKVLQSIERKIKAVFLLLKHANEIAKTSKKKKKKKKKKMFEPVCIYFD